MVRLYVTNFSVHNKNEQKLAKGKRSKESGSHQASQLPAVLSSSALGHIMDDLYNDLIEFASLCRNPNASANTVL